MQLLELGNFYHYNIGEYEAALSDEYESVFEE